MGRANPALDIWVWSAWLGQPEIAALRDAGHRISVIGSPYNVAFFCPVADAEHVAPDLILHPAAHAWSAEMFETPYLKAALTAARKRRKAGAA